MDGEPCFSIRIIFLFIYKGIQMIYFIHFLKMKSKLKLDCCATQMKLCRLGLSYVISKQHRVVKETKLQDK